MKSSFSFEGECVNVDEEPAGYVVVSHSHAGVAEKAYAPRFTRGEWAAFIRGVKAGEFDLTTERELDKDGEVE